jgi:hypothetical protein
MISINWLVVSRGFFAKISSASQVKLFSFHFFRFLFNDIRKIKEREETVMAPPPNHQPHAEFDFFHLRSPAAKETGR